MANPKNPNRLDFGGETKTLTTMIPYKSYDLFGKSFKGVYSPIELSNAKRIDVEFNTLSEDWNIYRLEDRRKMKTKLVISTIWRAVDKYDKYGIPIYGFESSALVNVSKKK